jgi:CDP-diacylglycerol--glycerol-3-phosphate 3-phosphatidyltransferase
MATTSFRGIYAIKPWWQRRLVVIEDWLVEHRVHPNLVTLAGVGCAGLLGVALAAEAAWQWLALVVAPLAIGRLAANALDGLVARRTGLASARGELFNEFGDRIADTAVLVGLAINSHVFAPLAWGVLVLTLLSSYLGIAAKAVGGQRIFGGLLAKADRMIYLAVFSPVALFMGPAAWNWLLIAFVPALLLTVLQRYRWSLSALKPS